MPERKIEQYEELIKDMKEEIVRLRIDTARIPSGNCVNSYYKPNGFSTEELCKIGDCSECRYQYLTALFLEETKKVNEEYKIPEEKENVEKMNKKMKVKIILKSGYEIQLECDNFKVKQSLSSDITGYSFEGLDTNNSIYPIAINVNEIAAVIQCP